VPPVEQNKPLGEGYFLTSQIQRFNTHIRATAAAKNLPLQDIYLALANAQGYMPAGGTTDGVHFVRAKQVDYFDRLQSGVTAALAKEGKTCP
jgi:lysophospholipase L1-like esterase